MSAPVFSARRILQPGPPRADRVSVAVVRRPRRALVWLPEGRTLHDALVTAFARFGVRAGALALLGGELSAAAYHVAVPFRTVPVRRITDRPYNSAAEPVSCGLQDRMARICPEAHCFTFTASWPNRADKRTGGILRRTGAWWVPPASGLSFCSALVSSAWLTVKHERRCSFPFSEVTHMPQSTILEINTGRVASVRVAPTRISSKVLTRRRRIWGSVAPWCAADWAASSTPPLRASKVLRTGSRGPPSSFCPCPARFRSKKVALNRPASRVLSVTHRQDLGRSIRARANPVCITIEAVLEELLVAPEEDWRKPF